jgi:hypothetical protein
MAKQTTITVETSSLLILQAGFPAAPGAAMR